MNARYVVIYKLQGANALPDEVECASLLTLQRPAVTAMLTTDPNPSFFHVDKSAALGTLYLKGLFAPDKEGAPQEWLAAEIEEARTRRAKQTGTGVFLVLNGETELPAPDFTARFDTEEFAFCLEAIAKPAIRECFRLSVQSVLTALVLSLPANAARRVEKLGHVVYLIDPSNGKPIYSFDFHLSGRLYLSSPLTRHALAETAALAPKLLIDKALERPNSLLAHSLDDATETLQGFIAAWSALEIFVNAIFKSTYEARWFAIIEDGAPALRRQFSTVSNK